MSKYQPYGSKIKIGQQRGQDKPTQSNTFVQHESEVVQMNARVSSELKERVRIYCAIENITYQEFFEEALTDFLDRHSAK